MQETKKLSDSVCTFYPIDKPQIQYDIYQDALTNGIAENVHLNRTLKKLVKSLEGRTLILVERVEHGEILNKMIKKSVWIYGKDSIKERKPIIESLTDSKDKLVVIATRHIMSTGINVKIHNLINCAGGKAEHEIIQRIGRGLRLADDKEKLKYFDFYFRINPYLENHSKKRVKILREEGHEVIVKDEIDF